MQYDNSITNFTTKYSQVMKSIFDILCIQSICYIPYEMISIVLQILYGAQDIPTFIGVEKLANSIEQSK